MWRKFQGTFDGQRCNVFNFIGTRPDVGGRNRSKISVVDEMGLHTVDVDGLESSAIPASILRMQNGVNGSHDQLVAVQFRFLFYIKQKLLDVSNHRFVTLILNPKEMCRFDVRNINRALLFDFRGDSWW